MVTRPSSNSDEDINSPLAVKARSWAQTASLNSHKKANKQLRKHPLIVGDICEFLCDTPGTISLHENGRNVIDLEILQNAIPDQFSLRELNAFNFGTWIENIVRIEEEIKSHNDIQVKSTGSQT